VFVPFERVAEGLAGLADLLLVALAIAADANVASSLLFLSGRNTRSLTRADSHAVDKALPR